HAQSPEQQEENADQDREGRGECVELRCAVCRDGAQTQRGDQAGCGVRRELRNFGSDAVNARDFLRRYATAKVAAPWPEEPQRPTFDDSTSLRLLDQFQTALRGLTPKTEEERLSLADANQAADDVVKITWRQVALGANTFSHPFLLIV